MRAGFNVYRSFEQDAKDNRSYIDMYSKLSTPCLILSGEKSFEREFAQSMGKDFFESFETDVCPGAGHWIAEETPDSFVEKVSNYIKRYSDVYTT